MDIVMPRLGDTMEDGTVLAWRKHPGDLVSQGEILCQIETDKSTVDLESDLAGRIVTIYVEAGATVPIGTPIVRIEA